MFNAEFFAVLAAVLAVLAGVSEGMNCKGCTPLDEVTFDKMLRNFPVSVVKFDTAYPYGDKHEEFAKVALDGSSMDDVLIGEVGIKDYGDKDNEELGTRYAGRPGSYFVNCFEMVFITHLWKS